MTNKERWAGWYLVCSGTAQYLGKDRATHADAQNTALRFFTLQPCVKIIEQFPVIPDPKGQPVIMPVLSFVTIGMFQTEDIKLSVHADAWVEMQDCSEEQLQRYSDGYDSMLRQARDNLDKERRRSSTIALPSENDRIKLGIKR